MPLMPRVLDAVFRRFWPYEIIGKENLPARGPVVLVANHASLLDGVLLYVALPRVPRFVVWTQHYEEVLLGWLYRRLDAIPVEGWRTDVVPIGQEAYRAAKAHLEGGGVLAVFPEGGRTPDGRFMCWRTGAARLALAASAPIVPLTINGMYEAWPIHQPRPRRWRIEVIVHPPVSPEPWLAIRRRKDAALALTRHVRNIVAGAYRLPGAAYAPPPGWRSPHPDLPCPLAEMDGSPPPYGAARGGL